MAKRDKKVSDVRVAYGAGRKASQIAGERSLAETERDWDWFQEHEPELAKQYAGQWIAIAGQQIVGNGVRLRTALKRAQARGVRHPFVTAFPSEELQQLPRIGHWL